MGALGYIKTELSQIHQDGDCVARTHGTPTRSLCCEVGGRNPTSDGTNEDWMGVLEADIRGPQMQICIVRPSPELPGSEHEVCCVLMHESVIYYTWPTNDG